MACYGKGLVCQQFSNYEDITCVRIHSSTLITGEGTSDITHTEEIEHSAHDHTQDTEEKVTTSSDEQEHVYDNTTNNGYRLGLVCEAFEEL